MNSVKPERLLLPLICFLLIAMFCWPVLLNRASFDFHLNNTYFVVNTLPVILYALLYCSLLFVIYTTLRKKSGSINAGIALSHIIVTNVFVGLLLFAPFFAENNFPRRYVDYSDWKGLNDDYSARMIFFILIGILFVVAQMVFFVYAVIKVFKKTKQFN